MRVHRVSGTAFLPVIEGNSGLDAGSGLIVGTHPAVVGVVGAVAAAPGELVVRNGGVAQVTKIYIGTDGTVKGNAGTHGTGD